MYQIKCFHVKLFMSFICIVFQTEKKKEGTEIIKKIKKIKKYNSLLNSIYIKN